VSKTLHVIVPGRPVPKGRPRVVAGHAHTPKRTRDYERHARACVQTAVMAQRWTPPEGDVWVSVQLVFDTRTHGDVDNHAKAIMDAAQGLAFGDDKKVRILHVMREYGSEPLCRMTVCALGEVDGPPKKQRKRATARREP